MLAFTPGTHSNSNQSVTGCVKNLLLVAAVLPVLSGLTACKTTSHHKTTAARPVKSAKAQAVEVAVDSWRPRLGKVALVDEKGGFVLVDIGTAPTPSSGTGLRSYSASGATSELTVSSFQRRPYLIANIAKGHPLQGDSVAIVSAVPGDSLPKESAKEVFESKPVASTGADSVPSTAPKKPAPPAPVRYIVPPKTDTTQYVPVITEPAADGIIPGLPAAKKK